MTHARPTPLDSGVRGDTNLFGFIVTVNFNHELLKDSSTYSGSRERDVPENVRDLNMALTHEGIHFFHSMTTSYLYRLAVKLWGEVKSCRQRLRNMPAGMPIRLPMGGMESIGKAFADLGIKSPALSGGQISGVSTLDVIEGAAVFISHRMQLPDIGHTGFVHRLDTLYGPAPSPYCDAFRLGDWYLGEDIFEVFSPLCFVALCSDDPGRTYSRSIEIVGKSGILRRNKRPAAQEIIELIQTSEIGELRTAPEEIDALEKHPILTPYIRQLIRERPDLPFKEFAARPYESDDVDLFKYLVPPLIRYNDGRGILSAKLPELLPLAADTSTDDQAAFLIHFTAMCGAVLAIAEPADYYMQCPHRDCPYFPLRLCHSFAPIPTDYRDCGFVQTFEEIFRKPLRAVVRG